MRKLRMILAIILVIVILAIPLIALAPSEAESSVDENGEINNARNYYGVTLPEAGGIGRTIFIVTGLLLMACSLIALIVRKFIMRVGK